MGRLPFMKARLSGIALAEVLMITAMFLLVASLFIRFRYGHAWLAAEYSFVESHGISRGVYDTCKIAFFRVLAVCYLAYRIRQAWRHR